MHFEARLATAEGSDFLLSGTQVIGRGQDCELTLSDSEASRRHAQLSIEDQQVWLEDLGSANGTRVNGTRLTSRSALRAGDIIEIGNTRLLLTINGEGAAPVAAEDATMIAADATVLAAGEAASAVELPGAWTDDESADKTEFLAAAGGAQARPDVQRQSTAAHLVISDSTGSIADVLELTLEQEETVWEIGRDSGCDIQLNDPTVSGRHAQLIYKDGRWRAVNLISSNGLIVNGEKRLSVYLGDGDQISLGSLCVVFFAAVDGAARPAAPAQQRSGSSGQQRAGSKTLIIGISIGVLLLAAGAAAWFMLG